MLKPIACCYHHLTDMLVEFSQIPIYRSLTNAAMYDIRQYLHMNAGSNTANGLTSQCTAKYPSA